MSETVNNGGYAYPQPAFINQNGEVATASHYFGEATGQTLRQWYAGKALSTLNSSEFTESSWAKHMAEQAFAIADAMIAHEASERGGGQ